MFLKSNLKKKKSVSQSWRTLVVLHVYLTTCFVVLANSACLHLTERVQYFNFYLFLVRSHVYFLVSL